MTTRYFTILLMFILHQTSFSQTNQNLEAHYTFDQSINDFSGNNHHLQIINNASISYTNDRNGIPNGAIAFNGSGGLKSILPFHNSTFQEESVSFWIKTWGNQSIRQCIVQGAHAGFANVIAPNEDHISGFFDGNSAGSFTINNYVVNDNSWHHVVFTNDGNNTKAYFDGVYIGQMPESLYTSANSSSTPYLYIGRTNLINNELTGLIDDLRIYSIAIDSTVVNQLYQPAAMALTISQDLTILCHGDSSASASINLTGGSAPYSYSWSNGATTSNINQLGAGTYTLTVTDANGQTEIDSISIIQPDSLSIQLVSGHNQSCLNSTDGFVSINSSGGVNPYSYSWSNGSNSNTINNLGAGTYTLTITDQNGCENTFDYLVSPLPIPHVNLGADTLICKEDWQDSLVLSAFDSSITSYLWSTTDTTSSITIFNGGVYYLEVTSIDGCSASDSIDVTIENCLSVDNLLSFEWKLFPNPTKGLINIEFDDTNFDDTSVEVLSINGKTQLSKRVKSSRVTIDLSHLAKGIYFVRLNHDSKSEIKKIIIH